MTFKILFIHLLFVISSYSSAKLFVITTTTDIKLLVEKIGGNKVEVESLLNGSEDPHYIDAMPHFVGKVANADVFCMVGLDLEVGWAPKILTRSGNSKVQSGGAGYCETGKTVKALNVPQGKIDRSQGDVHPSGNPHYHLSPSAFLQGGETVLNTLIAVDAKNAPYYLAQFDILSKEIKALKKKIAKILSPVKNRNFLEYHREFTYFMHEYGLNNLGAVEKVPGVPPSAGRLARVSIKSKSQNIYATLSTTTSPRSVLEKFNEMSKTPVLRLPLSVLKDSTPTTYEEHQVYLANKIVNILNNEK